MYHITKLPGVPDFIYIYTASEWLDFSFQTQQSFTYLCDYMY